MTSCRPPSDDPPLRLAPRQRRRGPLAERSAARLAHQSGGLGVPGSNPGAPTKIAAAIAARRDAIPRACLHCDFGRFCTVSGLTPRPVLVAEDRRAALSLGAPSSPYPAQGPQRPIKTPTA